MTTNCQLARQTRSFKGKKKAKAIKDIFESGYIKYFYFINLKNLERFIYNLLYINYR